MASYLTGKVGDPKHTSAAKKRSFTSPWWKIIKKDEGDYIRVTDANHKNAVVMGRPLLIVQTEPNFDMLYCGFLLVMPIFPIGNFKVEGGPFGNFDFEVTGQTWSKESYTKYYSGFIEQYKSKGQLYINTKIELLKFR